MSKCLNTEIVALQLMLFYINSPGRPEHCSDKKALSALCTQPVSTIKIYAPPLNICISWRAVETVRFLNFL